MAPKTSVLAMLAAALAIVGLASRCTDDHAPPAPAATATVVVGPAAPATATAPPGFARTRAPLPGDDPGERDPAGVANGTGSVSVHAIHALDGAPAIGMNLRLDAARPPRDATTGTAERPRCGNRARADARGVAFFDGVPAGDYLLRNDRLDPDLPITVRAGGHLSIAYTVHPGLRVAGTVHNEAGVPIAGARIELLAPGESAALEHVADADAAGGFAVRDVHVHCQLVARADGFRAAFVHLQRLADAKNVRLVLAPGGGTVWGHVVDAAGLPVADALVQFDAERQGDPRVLRVRSDRRGEFRVSGLAYGEHAWSALAPGLVARGSGRTGEPLCIVLAPSPPAESDAGTTAPPHRQTIDTMFRPRR